jgi:alcohol dehydrogenase (cytochrome c)
MPMIRRTLTCVALLALAAMLVSTTVAQNTVEGFVPITDEILLNPADGDWIHWRRTYDQWGYSPLDQINTDNVSELRLVWAWDMVDGRQYATPLVYDGVMYLHNLGERVQAINAATGDLIWQYDRALPGDVSIQGSRMRAMSMKDNLLYVTTADVFIIALDATTGQLVWETEVAPYEENWRLTAGSTVVGDVVIVPMSGCGGAQPGGCFIAAFDAANGEFLWRVNTIGEPGTPEGDTWNDLPWESRFGSSVWNPGSYDPELDLYYIGTGQPYPWIAEMSGLWPVNPGSNADALYTDTTLAIRPSTGEIVWYYQWLPNDTWDLDYAYEQILVDLEHDGETVPALVTVGKLGIIEAVDRRDGSYLWGVETLFQNVIEAIDPVTGEKTINMDTWPAIGETTVNCPADPGGRSWAATAYSPRTGALYLPMQEFCSDTTPNPLGEGEVYTGGGRATFARRPIPGSDGNIGRVDAVNLTNQEEMWSHRMRSANGGSAALTTGGGLVFTGNLARYFMAFDDTTGEKLWEVRLSNLPNGFPITFEADGRQFVAVPVGRGSGPSNAFAVLTPEIINPPGGSSLFVFALPE